MYIGLSIVLMYLYRYTIKFGVLQKEKKIQKFVLDEADKLLARKQPAGMYILDAERDVAAIRVEGQLLAAERETVHNRIGLIAVGSDEDFRVG